jgi:DNA-binding MarR family transcriptional regulator
VTVTQRHVLAHLHANPYTRTADLAAALGLDEDAVHAAVDALIDAGHVQRHGDTLVAERRDADPAESAKR